MLFDLRGFGRHLARALACLLIVLPVLAAGAAHAQQLLLIDGAGDGHGVGMSQYGAYGLALHGFDYRAILAHYYAGTQLQPLAPRTVQVLMQSGRSSAAFSGATRANGLRLRPPASYRVVTGRGGVVLLGRSSRPLLTARRLVVSATRAVTLAGRALNGHSGGRYRGSLVIQQSHGRLAVYDSLALDDYVRGVVAAESDASWPLAELEAQAVASRTFALTAGRLYADTRSQEYGGVAAETRSTDRAVALTAGQILTYAGHPAITYYFDSSGGRTEDVENAFPGTKPEPWLVSVDDPYDSLAPKHHWGPYRLSLASAAARLGGLVHGSLRAIDVTRRGRSPRILAARIVGSAGASPASGGELQARFGLPSTWACFAVTDARGRAPAGWDAPCRGGATTPGPGGGGGPGGGTAAP